MTDQTTDMAAPPVARTHRPPRAEFTVYFAIVFLAALPLACLTWALHAAKSGRLPERGPVARAWTQARLITPMIFSAP